MHVDDLITILASSYPVSGNSWDTNLLYSFSDQINRGNGLTEKQAILALKILKKFSSTLQRIPNLDLDAVLKNPTYRYPVRQVSNARKISVVEHPSWTRAFKVEFPYNEKYITEIRQKRESIGMAQWSKDDKAWMFSLDERNITFLLTLMTQDPFQLDEKSQNLFDQYNGVLENMENHVPMLVEDNGILKFKNVLGSVPELQSQNLLEAIFEARKCGILTWDETISQKIDEANLNEFTRAFIEKDPSEDLQVNCEKFDISILSDIVNYLGPSLIVVPGGNELNKLKMAYNFLKDSGFQNEEMSVMFRLPTTIGKDFNNFVKDNDLNSPLGENTKIVFISSKLPKPVLKSKIHFHSIINLGFESVHYTLRDFLKNHENLIFFSEKKTQKEFNFGNV